MTCVCIYIVDAQQEEPIQDQPLRPHQTRGRGGGRRRQFRLPDAVLGGDVHAQQAHHLAVDLLHHQHLLPPQERHLNRAVPHQPGHDHLRPRRQLHDAAPTHGGMIPDRLQPLSYAHTSLYDIVKRSVMIDNNYTDMWFKNAANSMWSATKGLLDKRTPIEKLVDEIVACHEEVVPTTKLSELANMTYDLDNLEQIVSLAIEGIKKFKYDMDEAKKTLNLLITINYLIKHGATAFVDELREFIPTFKKYQVLEEHPTYDDQNLQAKFNFELDKIKSRAQHIQALLQDKSKLLKEKELSMLVKQKLKLYEKQRESAGPMSHGSKGEQKNQDSQGQQQRMGKIQGMMEKYLWQYVDKIDGKIEEVSDKIMEQVDKYVLGEVPPEKFELDDDDEGEEGDRGAGGYHSLSDDRQDELMKRLEEEGAGEGNLLQFEEVQQDEEGEESLKQPQHAQLI